MADQVRRIHTSIVSEPDGTLGTLCVCQATGPEALVEHARRVACRPKTLSRRSIPR
jgi:hypothetical protein